jgi:hypothetical protein
MLYGMVGHALLSNHSIGLSSLSNLLSNFSLCAPAGLAP